MPKWISLLTSRPQLHELVHVVGSWSSLKDQSPKLTRCRFFQNVINVFSWSEEANLQIGACVAPPFCVSLVQTESSVFCHAGQEMCTKICRVNS